MMFLRVGWELPPTSPNFNFVNLPNSSPLCLLSCGSCGLSPNLIIDIYFPQLKFVVFFCCFISKRFILQTSLKKDKCFDLLVGVKELLMHKLGTRNEVVWLAVKMMHRCRVCVCVYWCSIQPRNTEWSLGCSWSPRISLSLMFVGQNPSINHTNCRSPCNIYDNRRNDTILIASIPHLFWWKTLRSGLLLLFTRNLLSSTLCMW